MLTVSILTLVADEERRMISKRTKEALAAAVQLGGDRGARLTAKARAAGTAAMQTRHKPGRTIRPTR